MFERKQFKVVKFNLFSSSVYSAAVVALFALPLIQVQALGQNNQSPNRMSTSSSALAGAPANSATDKKLLIEWFKKYDQIRRKAQLNPRARAEADALLSKGLAIIVPGDDKKATQKLLRDLVTRYNVAAESLKLLPLYPETEKLHRGYYQYFSQARALFADYIAVQNNILVPDANGNPLAKSLMPRKLQLENLDRSNKAMDDFLRKRFGIKAYSYTDH